MEIVEYAFPDEPAATGYCVFPTALEDEELVLFHATLAANLEAIIKGETRPLRRRLPLRGPAFDGRIRRPDIVQIVVRHHVEHVIGGVMAPFHPGVNVVAPAMELEGRPRCGGSNDARYYRSLNKPA